MPCSRKLAARIAAAEAECDRLRGLINEPDEDLCVGPRPHWERELLVAEIELLKLRLKATDEGKR